MLADVSSGLFDADGGEAPPPIGVPGETGLNGTGNGKGVRTAARASMSRCQRDPFMQTSWMMLLVKRAHAHTHADSSRATCCIDEHH